MAHVITGTEEYLPFMTENVAFSVSNINVYTLRVGEAFYVDTLGTVGIGAYRVVIYTNGTSNGLGVCGLSAVSNLVNVDGYDGDGSVLIGSYLHSTKVNSLNDCHVLRVESGDLGDISYSTIFRGGRVDLDGDRKMVVVRNYNNADEVSYGILGNGKVMVARFGEHWHLVVDID